MEFLVTVMGLPAFCYTAPTRRAASAATCHCGARCQRMQENGRCLALEAVDGVLDFFSDVVSYETALVVCRAGQGTAVYEETGQRAAVRLLLAGMQNSGCPFFSRFTPLPVDAPLTSAYIAFSRLLQALSQTGTTVVSNTAAPGLGEALESHLAPVLAEAKRRRRRDAAVNAVILMVSAIRLAVEDAAPSAAKHCRRLGRAPGPAGRG